MRAVATIFTSLTAAFAALAPVAGQAQQTGANWALSGRVVDAASGRPIGGAQVFATLDSSPVRGYSTSSDADGAYHFDRVLSGSYFVYVTVTHRTSDLDRASLEPRSLMSIAMSPSLTFATTLHPSAASAESARLVVVDAGQNRSGIDIGVRRVPGRRVTGTVVGPRFGAGATGEALVLLSADDVRFKRGSPNGGSATAATVTQTGTFAFAAVPPGTYTIEAYPAGRVDGASPPDVRMVGALTVGDVDVAGVVVKVPVR